MSIGNFIGGYALGMVYLLEIFAFMYMAKYLSDHRVSSKFDANHEIEENSNGGIGLRRGGLYLAIAIGMLGTVTAPSMAHSFLGDILAVALDGMFVLVFVMTARIIFDAVVIHDLDNDQAIKDGNKAVGFVEAGGYIATGVIAFSSFHGEGGPWYSSLVFFVLGQVVLLAMVRAYEVFAPFNAVEEVYRGNEAAGLLLGGMMVAIAFMLYGAISGPFTGWLADLTSFALSAAAGIVLMIFVINKYVDQLFLPGTDIRTEVVRDRNVAAITVVVAVKIALGLALGMVVV